MSGVQFLVFGAGALGSLVGGLLAQEHEVTLVGRHTHMDAVHRHGLRITGKTERVVHPGAVESLPKGKPPDIVLLTVKAYDTTSAVQELKPYWRESIFLSLQNGLGNEELLARRAAKVLGGVTELGVTFVEPGVVFHAGVGKTYVGTVKGVERDQTMEVVNTFSSCGMPCHLAEDIRTELWLKAVVNACINPLTGLLGVRNGVLSKNEDLREIIQRVIEEGVEVAAAEGIELEVDYVAERVWSVAEATADNKSSMLQDLEKGAKTEIDAISGAIVKAGRSHRIACPYNSALALLVKASEWTRQSRQ